MAVTNSLEIDLGYTYTDYTRTYKINDVDSSVLPNIKAKINAYNADIPAADKKIFISDDYDDTDPNNIIGAFNGIIAARIVTVEENKIT